VTDWLTDWVTDWVTDWLTDWQSDWLSDWLTDWMTEWLTDWLLLYPLRFSNWPNEFPCLFSSIYLSPLSKTQATAGIPPSVNIPQKCTSAHSWPPLRIQTLYGKDTCQRCIHIAWQVHVYKLKYKTLPSLFNINQPVPDDQFIFSSFWLPSPRFELRTLAGYTSQPASTLPQMVTFQKCVAMQ